MKNIIIAVISILIIGFCAFFVYNKYILKDNNKVVNKNTNNKSEEKLKGVCPLTKFDKNYILTETDKNEIKELIINDSLELEDTIDVDSIKISSISDDGYYINIEYKYESEGNASSYKIAKVSGQFKVIVDFGEVSNDTQIMEYTLKKLCE